MNFSVVNVSYMDIFPQEIFEDNSLSSELSAALRVIQNLNFCFNNDATSIKAFIQLIDDKRLFIRELARELTFINCEEIFYKKCGGHDIRINTKRFKKEKKAKKFGLKWLKENFQNHPYIRSTHLYTKKLNRHRPYDVRVRFFHIDNTPSCTYPATVKASSVYKSVIKMLDKFESEIQRTGLDLDEAYSKILQVVSQPL